MTLITRLNDVDAKLAKRINGKLRVYSDGERINVRCWKSGEECNVHLPMEQVADAIRASLASSDNDYSQVVPALRNL